MHPTNSFWLWMEQAMHWLGGGTMTACGGVHMEKNREICSGGGGAQTRRCDCDVTSSLAHQLVSCSEASII
jgi:hypothetical protein